MVNCISILGSTGSIGRQTLDVITHLPVQVGALTAGTNVDLMEQQCRQFRPRLAVMATREAAEMLAKRISDLPITVKSGEEGLIVTSRIADQVGITRSVCVNALKKLESAGLIATQSAGMKGTHIRVVNKILTYSLLK